MIRSSNLEDAINMQVANIQGVSNKTIDSIQLIETALNDNVMLSFVVRINRFSPKHKNSYEVKEKNEGGAVTSYIKENSKLRTTSLEASLNYVI